MLHDLTKAAEERRDGDTMEPAVQQKAKEVPNALIPV